MNVNEVMGGKEMEGGVSVKDCVIEVKERVELNDLWEGGVERNGCLLEGEEKRVLGELDYKKVLWGKYG